MGSLSSLNLTDFPTIIRIIIMFLIMASETLNFWIPAWCSRLNTRCKSWSPIYWSPMGTLSLPLMLQDPSYLKEFLHKVPSAWNILPLVLTLIVSGNLHHPWHTFFKVLASDKAYLCTLYQTLSLLSVPTSPRSLSEWSLLFSIAHVLVKWFSVSSNEL